MGEYAEQYTIKTFNINSSVPNKKAKWKWACPKCGKNLASQVAQNQHLKDKHKITESNVELGKSTMTDEPVNNHALRAPARTLG